MVSSFMPGAAGLGALGADVRFARDGAAMPQRHDEAFLRDRVELSGASLAAVRQSVRDGVAQAHHALALGHEAQAMLVNVQTLARSGAAQVDLQAVLQAFSQKLDAAIESGATLLSGASVSVQAELDAAPLSIPGADLRLKDDPGPQNIIAVSRNADIADPELPQAVQKSLEALQAAMGQLLETVQALEAHQGFLSAVDRAAAGVRTDLDADSARLLALQVRQGLEAVGSAPIANVEPQAVLALFRA